MTENNKIIMTGNEAIARGAYESGVTFASAYPGTPSTEILENMSTYDKVYSEWAPNEKVALESTIGASMAGARALASMKHVGVNVAMDPFMTLSYTGVNGGLVLITADDPGMHSSQNEQDNRNLGPFAKVPMLEPSDSEECKVLMKKAYEMSEEFDTPVLFRITTRIAHSRSIVELKDREEISLKPYVKDPSKYCMVPANARGRRLIVDDNMNKLKDYSEKFELNKTEWNSSKDIGIITSGVSYQYVKEAFGEEMNILKLTMTYPLPDNLIKEFCDKIEKVYIVEEGDPFLENQIKIMGIDVIGKEVFPHIGELSPSIIKKAILGEDKKIPFEGFEALPVRPPVMCSGCSHRGVYHVIKKMNGVVTGDIGCYSLGLVPPLSALDSLVCMGAGISMAHGFQKVYEQNEIGDKPVIGVIGDSTFLHSGITSLMNIVYNQSSPTIVVLDNRTTAMTGHQPNFSAGKDAKGKETPHIEIADLCKAIGIESVTTVDSYDLDEVERALKEGIALKDKPAVIIARRPCVLLKTTDPMGKYAVNQDKCITCKSCLNIGCPSIEFKDGRIEIDEPSCVGCSVCAQVCPVDAIERLGE